MVNFHLDTAGHNTNRAAQLRAIAMALEPRRDHSLIACGDTNCFSFDAAQADRDLAGMLEPLARRHGALDAHAGAAARVTHFFARAHEPSLGHRIAVAFGRLGVDFPRRYDILAAAPPAMAAGTVVTPESDHDLVWAALRSPGRSRCRPSAMRGRSKYL